MKLSQLRLLNSKVLLEPVSQVQSTTLHLPQRDVPHPVNQKLWRVLLTGPGERNDRGEVVAPPVKPGDIVAANLSQHHYHLFPSGRVIARTDQIFLIYDTDRIRHAA
jgi:co-chaperonin GroES (HSP10)